MLGPLGSSPERIGREVRAEMEYRFGLPAEDRDAYLPGQVAPIRLSVADGPKRRLVGLSGPMIGLLDPFTAPRLWLVLSAPRPTGWPSVSGKSLLRRIDAVAIVCGGPVFQGPRIPVNRAE